MVALTYDNRLETRLIQDKKPDPPKDNGEAVLKVVAATGLLLLLKITGVLDINIPLQVPSSIPTLAPVQDPYLIQTELPQQAPNSSLTSTYEISTSILGFRVQINQCNGANYDGANFRDYPALTPLTIRGVVQQGEWVTLTGKTVNADGVLWYEAINDSVLWNSNESGAQNQTYANQTGWIAACFIE